MIARLRRTSALLRTVFERHAERYLSITVAAPPPVMAAWRGGRLIVTVAQAAGPMALTLGQHKTQAEPGPTGDLHLSLPAPIGAGAAELTAPWLDGPVRLRVPDKAIHLRAQVAHLAPFARVLMGALPSALLLARRPGDTARAAALREALGLARLSTAGDLMADRLKPVPPPRGGTPDRPIVVILPVHNAFDLMCAAVERIRLHTDLPYHLIVIDDASSDPRVRPWLRQALARFAPSTARLIEVDVNAGFVASANVGLGIAAGQGAHAVLLNSDTLVPPGWASRLMDPLLADPSVASVTPLSGASGLTTVPAIGPGAPLAEGVADALDLIAQRHSGARTAEVPTGMGFCMAMSGRFLERVPQFDRAFGTGYGEETDWCRRVAAFGGRHLAHAGVFVDHRGSASFGAGERDSRAAKAASLLRARYPGYEAQVARFADYDPLLTERLALGIARLAAMAGETRVAIYLAHALGGGAEAYLQARLARDVAQTGGAVVLRVGGRLRWRLELHGADHPPVAGLTQDNALVHDLLAPLRRRRVVYGCGVGDHDPITLPDALLALLTSPEDVLEVLLHDYFPASPAFTLLAADGWFHGMPHSDSSDIAHQARCRDGGRVSLAQWRESWRPVMQRANVIQAFSKASAELLCAAYPDDDLPLSIRPHALAQTPEAMPPGGRVLGLLGHIRDHKGAVVVAELARLRPDLPMALVGSFEATRRAPPGLRVLGPYHPQDLTRIARGADIGAWLIPSIWPETFCFTLHEALATGLPTLGFDLGAQGEALHHARAEGRAAFPVAAGNGPQEAARAILATLEHTRILPGFGISQAAD